MTWQCSTPANRPCDSLNAKLWIDWATEFIRLGDDVTVAAKKADQMVALFFARYPAKGGAS